MFGLVVGGHAIEQVVNRGRRPIGRSLINEHLGQPGRHADRHLNVQRHLFVATARFATRGHPVETVNQHILQADITHPRLTFVAGDVADVIAVQLDQPQRLAGAAKRGARNIGVTEVIAPKGMIRAGAGAGRGVRVRLRRFAPQAHGVGPGVIVQATDMQHRQAGGERGFGLRRKKGPGLLWVRIHLHHHMEGLFDLRNGPRHIQQHPVGMGAPDGQAVGLRKADRRLILLLRRAKCLRELFRRQIVVVVGTGRRVHLPQQVGERVPVAQRQTDGQVQLIGRRQPAGRLQPGHGRRHMTGQHSRVGGLGCQRHENPRCQDHRF